MSKYISYVYLKILEGMPFVLATLSNEYIIVYPNDVLVCGYEKHYRKNDANLQKV